MSESADGVSVSCTRQNVGSPVIGRGAAVPSTGGMNDPAGTTVAEVTFAFVSFSVAATRLQSCADATMGANVNTPTTNRSFIPFCRVPASAEASAGKLDPASTSHLLRTSNIALRASAGEVGSIIDASASLVDRHLRERTERPASIDLAVG